MPAMAERRKARKKNDKDKDETPEKMTKLQKRVTSWMRKNVPTKKTKFMHSHVVNYFVGSKAVDALMNDSPWSKEKAKEGQELVFEYREKAVDYLDTLLRQKMFHRAKKIPVAEKEKKKKKGDKAETETEDEKAKDKTEEKEKKKKRKIRLDMHMEQIFLDVNDAYVWLYDPIPWYYWLGGTGIVLGIIALCLFPLWPTEARKSVYYLSVAAAGFLVFIIALAVVNDEESDDERKEDEKGDGEDAARDGDKEGSDSEESRGSAGKDFEIIENKDEDKDKDI